MLGHSHCIVGGCGFLAVGAPALSLTGHPLTVPELAAGAVVCAGAAMLPDLDCPEATVSRALGPITGVISRVLAKVSGGHRNGTHSLLFAILVLIGLQAAIGAVPGPWIALAVSGLCCSLVIRVLTGARGLVSGALALILAAGLVTLAPSPMWVPWAVVLGVLLHDLADALTPEGVPPAWPVSRLRVSLPLVGHTGDWRENLIAGICGVAFCWLIATTVFLPAWQSQAAAHQIAAHRSSPGHGHVRAYRGREAGVTVALAARGS